jgi:hypothetical protein
LSAVFPPDLDRFTFFWHLDSPTRFAWRFEVSFEGSSTTADDVRYPVCLDGERASPPRSICDGAEFRAFLSVVSDPSHPQRREWLPNPSFNPDVFDVEAVNRLLRARFGGPDRVDGRFDPSPMAIRLRLTREEQGLVLGCARLQDEPTQRLDVWGNTQTLKLFVPEIDGVVRDLAAAADHAGPGRRRRRLESLIGRIERLRWSGQARSAAWQSQAQMAAANHPENENGNGRRQCEEP